MDKGFTLIEILVAITLFALVSVVASGIFINVNNLQQNTASLERLQSDGRYILEKMAREIRGRKIDFKGSGISAIKHETANLVFKPDEQDISAGISWDSNEKNLMYSVVAGTDQPQSAALNASDIEVTEANFMIQPGDDPETGFFPGIQPRVTIILKLTNRNASPRYRKELILQTTISSRFYTR